MRAAGVMRKAEEEDDESLLSSLGKQQIQQMAPMAPANNLFNQQAMAQPIQQARLHIII